MDEPAGLARSLAGAPGLEEARAAIARSTFCLQAARALIGERRPIDLSGLEAEIGRLCAGALALPAEEARTLLPSLSALCEEIDEAANALSRARSGPG